MGFPSGYTEVLLPKLLITTLSLLGLIRRLILSLLGALGLSDLIEPDLDWAERPEPAYTGPRSVAATLIQEMLPVSRYAEVGGAGESCACAVCLNEFEEGDEIRRLRNCGHMFHRRCVDRWMDHDRKTCPLCRTCLVPEELKQAFNDKLWAASGIPDFYSEYSPITNF